jgi:16S rRNA (cytidine1402-2'-O)-methyltransferase
MLTKKSLAVGTLYIVSTPIGHLDDMTFRAVETLKKADLIIAEDTRHSQKLLRHFGITTPVTSFHNYNEIQKTNEIIEKIQNGESISLISDAGTPLINDPGFIIVSEAKKRGIVVVPIPGACAAIAGLSVSGLPCDHFIFEGFLPAKVKARESYLKTLVYETRTLIFYESPHRIVSSLESLIEVFGPDRRACIARELTKVYESVQTSSLEDLLLKLINNPETQQGEFVLILAGAPEKEHSLEKVNIFPEQCLQILMSEMPLKKAAQLTEKITGIRKNTLYDLGLKLS